MILLFQAMNILNIIKILALKANSSVAYYFY